MPLFSRTLTGGEAVEGGTPLGEPLSRLARWYVGMSGLALLALLATAAVLEPSRRGYGTHQQLGLPPCSVQVLFGIPCPSCGMTTSWSHAMRGDMVASAECNPGGLLLALMAMVSGPWFLVSGLRGRWWMAVPNPWWFTFYVFVVVAITLAQWAYRLVMP